VRTLVGMSTDIIPLTPRQECFVAEYLKDGNATRAYIRAGYSPRGAQPSASRLLRDPGIAAAVAAGRRHIADALGVDVVTRLAQEYARIALANVGDFVSADADGRLRVDLEKASLAQQAGILELKITNNSKQEQSVTLKLGKLQALAALTKNVGVLVQRPVPGLTAEGRQGDEEHRAGLRRPLDHSKQEHQRPEREPSRSRDALAEAQATIPETCLVIPPEEPEKPRSPARPGMPTPPPPDRTPGLSPGAWFVGSGGKEQGPEPDSPEAQLTSAVARPTQQG
jgi:phage terminase small subunit